MSDNTSNDQKQLHAILFGYCFVLFGIISGLNAQTTFIKFGWLGRGGSAFASLLENPTFDNIEMWYLIAGLMFLAVHVVFIGLFIHSYYNEKINIRTRARSMLEIFYLSWVGGFSVIALHGPRLLLSYIPKIDPDFNEQSVFLQTVYNITPDDWTFGSTSTNWQVMEYAHYGIFLIVGYFAVLGILYVMRRKLNREIKNFQ